MPPAPDAFHTLMLLTDREEAGRLLAAKLVAWRDRDAVVLALPQAGVPVGVEIAPELHAPLDLVMVRKIGAPDQPELAIGAVADGVEPQLIVDSRLVTALGVSWSTSRKQEIRAGRNRPPPFRVSEGTIACAP